jgi:hypothetical protein
MSCGKLVLELFSLSLLLNLELFSNDGQVFELWRPAGRPAGSVNDMLAGAVITWQDWWERKKERKEEFRGCTDILAQRFDLLLL